MTLHPILHLPGALATMGRSRPNGGSASDVPVRPMVTVAGWSFVSRGAPGPTPGAELVTLTSVLDCRAHMVTDIEFSSEHALRMGRYQALCGHLIAPAPMVDPDGTRCTRCAELGGVGPAVERPSRRGRPRGLGRRLLA